MTTPGAQLRSTTSPGATTTTLTVENSSSRQQPETLVLELRPRRKKVTWKEGTVDNEFLNKKSSKKCCIFHKQKPFDEDDSDDENCPHDRSKRNDHDHDHGRGCCSKHEAGTSRCGSEG